MTHQTKSVRTHAEAVNPTTPTFDEVYAHPYVQASIKFLVENNSIEYPMLAPYGDDIRQEMLIYLAKCLPSYDSRRSGIKTFCRRVLESGLKLARRYYFTDTQKALSQAVPLEDLEDCYSENEKDTVNSKLRDSIDMYSASPFEDSDKREQFDFALSKLLPQDHAIANAIMDGVPLREIAKRGLCSNNYQLYHKILPRIRAVFKENFYFFQKN